MMIMEALAAMRVKAHARAFIPDATANEADYAAIEITGERPPWEAVKLAMLEIARAHAAQFVQQAADAKHRTVHAASPEQHQRHLAKAEDVRLMQLGDEGATGRLTREAEARGVPVASLANAIDAKRSQMKDTAARIEATRAAALIAIRNAGDVATVLDIAKSVPATLAGAP